MSLSRPDDDAKEGDFLERDILFIEHLELGSKETDRGRVLLFATQIDFHLREIFQAFLIDDKEVKKLFEIPYAPLASLSGRASMSYVLGLITASEKRRIDAVRKVRNAFARKIDISFGSPAVKELCSKPPIADGKNTDRDAFMHMVLNVIPPLLYRSRRVKRHWKRRALPEAEAFEERAAVRTEQHLSIPAHDAAFRARVLADAGGGRD